MAMRIVAAMALFAIWLGGPQTNQDNVLNPSRDGRALRGRIAEAVTQAKKKGNREAVLSPPILDYWRPPNLEQALRSFDLAVIEPVELSPRVDDSGDHVVTWYKFRIVERFSSGADQPVDHPIRIPDDLNPAASGECFNRMAGGKVVLDGITVREAYREKPFKKGTQYLVFLKPTNGDWCGLVGGPSNWLEIRDGRVYPFTKQRGSLQAEMVSKLGETLQQIQDKLVTIRKQ